MSAAISLSDPIAAPVPGVARLSVRAEGGRTHLVDLDQVAPLRLMLPHVARDEPLTAFLTNTSGGLVGGDAMQVSVSVGADASALVMAQAAEKVYRSLGADCRIDVTLEADSGAWLEWLPQETILFDAARLRRQTRLDLAPDARAMAGEILVFGRTAHGEVVNSGLIRDAWQVRIGGRLVWADALHMDGDLRGPLDSASGFAGHHACATLVLYAPGPEAQRDVLRDLPPPEGVRFGVTVINGLLVGRWLGRDALALREHFASVWGGLRAAAAGLPARLPRLWYI